MQNSIAQDLTHPQFHKRIRQRQASFDVNDTNVKDEFNTTLILGKVRANLLILEPI
jgi:hypothetical protein